MDLVVLAGGLGSRFGGLKQIEPIDKNGNFIIDYSIFDAIRAGFDKVVFVIKKENLKDFKQSIEHRINGKIKVEYAFQNLDSFVPKNFNFLNRTKPWGTAHAILCAKNYVNDNFAMINADDFYGKDAYKKIFDFLQNNHLENNFAMVGYKVKNTLTENGEVKRGICKVEKGNLKSVEESVINFENNNIVAKPINEDCCKKPIDENTLVSMNLFGFTPKLFDYLEKEFINFLQVNKNDLSTCEYFIPNVLTKYIKEGLGDLKVLDTYEKWYGLTYRKDYDSVCEGILNLVNKNVYPVNLWS